MRASISRAPYPRQGLSLVEVLVVIAIILMLGALIFPIFVAAKRKAYVPPCSSQLRQVVMALLQYVEDNNGFPRTNDLSIALRDGIVKNSEMFLCPADEFRGLRSVELRCLGYRIKVSQSYYTPFDSWNTLWHAIQEVDANPGIVVCRSHGTRTVKYAVDPTTVCSRIPWLFEGSVLRARQDGSVKSVPFSLAPDPEPGAFQTFRFWRLFTDETVLPGG